MTLESHPPSSKDSIYLGTMLRLFASRISDFQQLLAKPKSVPPTIATTFGKIEPLGFERFRICELYAELLHCSNMILLNDPRGEEIVKERDLERERTRREGRTDPPKVDIWGDTALPNGREWATDSYSTDGSDDETTADTAQHSTVENHQEQPATSDVHTEAASTPLNQTSTVPDDHRFVSDEQSHPRAAETSAEDISNAAAEDFPKQSSDKLVESIISPNGTSPNSTPNPSFDISETHGRPVVGDYLKMQFVEARVLPSVVDLFFAHPWNNFLHNVVYDILTQVLNREMDRGYNGQLAVDLFTGGQLTEKILLGQRASDEAQ